MVEELNSKIIETLTSVFKTIHGYIIPIEVIIDHLEKSSREYVIHGKYRLIVSKKYFTFKAIFDENAELKYLERVEKAKRKHPTLIP